MGIADRRIGDDDLSNIPIKRSANTPREFEQVWTSHRATSRDGPGLVGSRAGSPKFKIGRSQTTSALVCAETAGSGSRREQLAQRSGSPQHGAGTHRSDYAGGDVPTEGF